MKTACVFLFCLILLGFSTASAQPINESDVPEDVFTSFKYKYPGAAVRGWETSRGNFIANFRIEGQQALAEFTANGKWVVSSFSIPEKELPSPLITYFRENYRNRSFVITETVLVKTAAGETYYHLQTKKSGISQPKPSHLYFDLAGKLTKTEEPDENKIVVADIREATVTKQPTEKQADTAASASTGLSRRDLPPLIISYVKINYVDYGIRESKYVNDQELGDVYHITLKKDGVRELVELFFDINGKLLKKVDQLELRAEKVQEEVTLQEETKTVVVSERTPTPVEKEPEREDIPLDEARVPAAAKTHFLSKTRKPSGIEWFRVERNFMVRYAVAGNKGFSLYGEEGEWKETRVQLSESGLSTPVRNVLKDKYRRLKFVMAEHVQQNPKIKYLEVHMADKVSKASHPPVTKVFFDSGGKFMNDEKPEEETASGKGKKIDDKEFLKEVDASGKVVINQSTSVNEPVSVKELPTNIINYLRKEYPEHRISESRYVFDEDMNDHIYYITAKERGVKDELEFYFAIDGRLIKKIDPAEQRANKDFGSFDSDFSDDFETKDAQAVDQKDLPGGIQRFLKQKYPDFKVENSVFMNHEDHGNVYFLTLRKSGVRSKTMLYFDLDGNLVKSEQVSQ